MNRLVERIHEVFELRDGGLYRRSNGRRGYRRPDGYVYVRLDGHQYGEHRLVHHLVTGEWPVQVDHANGIRDDNRPENLRAATHSQNCMNRLTTSKYGKGVYWDAKRRRYAVQITKDGRRVTVGYFKSHADATMAHSEAERLAYGQFAMSRQRRPAPPSYNAVTTQPKGNQTNEQHEQQAP